MEALRAQLSFTQGELTERDVKFRQLKAEYREATNSWLKEKSTLEARLAQFESQNAATLEPTKPTTPAHCPVERPEFALARNSATNGLTTGDQQVAGADDTITLARSRVKEAEEQFKKMADEVAEKTRLCEALEAKLAQAGLTLGLGLDDKQAVVRWDQLQQQIRVLSLERLGANFSASLVADKYKDEFQLLSPHWKSYTSTPGMTSYLFRALIWRYILRYFVVLCRAYGRDVSKKVGEAADVLSTKLSTKEYQDWCIQTATLVHKVYPIDKSLIDELTDKIMQAIKPLITAQVDVAALKISIHKIVTTAAELSAEFDRTRLVVLMYDEPGSTRTHSFPLVGGLMDVQAKLGSQAVVDLMITPCLLKKDPEFSVLVKAEVIC